jgi:acylaminoacyl-peptidase
MHSGADAMMKLMAVSVILALAAVQAAAARPFTATDLARLERVSDPHVSPDGRFVAYNVRSTDWEANRGVNALWVLERGAVGAPPRLIRDQEKSGTSPRWSEDGRWLYFLSSRSGSLQLWRTLATGMETRQVTNLPLDIAFYRLAPDGRGLVAGWSRQWPRTLTAIPWLAARQRMMARRKRRRPECCTTARLHASGTPILTGALLAFSP